MALFALLGALGHVLRGSVNFYPDRLSDSPSMDFLISDGFDLSDYLFGTEYDDYGYYRLDSRKNLRISVTSSVFGGILALVLCEGLGLQIAAAMNQAAEAFAELVRLRFSSLFSA